MYHINSRSHGREGGIMTVASDMTTHEGRANFRNAINIALVVRPFGERAMIPLNPQMVLALLDWVDELDPPPEPKTEDDPRFHFCRVTNDLADLQGKLCEAMDRVTRLAASVGQTTRAFFASRDK